MTELAEELKQLAAEFADRLCLVLNDRQLALLREDFGDFAEEVCRKSLEAAGKKIEAYVPIIGNLDERVWQVKRELAGDIRALLPQPPEQEESRG